MGIEQMVIDALVRYVPRPTLWQAKNCFEVHKIQKAAVEAAALKREEAIEVNTRRRELEKLPPLNHRDFLVASVAVGIMPVQNRDDRYDWFVSAAWNTKPHANQQKFCAEKRNGRRALRWGCKCLVGIATVGELNAGGDGRSGKHGPGPTLDMCEACRDDAQGELRALYSDDTLVINENSVTRVRTEPRTMREIFTHHNETWWATDPKVVSLFGGR